MIWPTALRLAAENGRLKRRNAELVQALGLANHATETAIRTANAWKARAELCALLAGPAALPYLKQQTEIERLDEVPEADHG